MFLEDIPDPKPQSGEVLVKVTAAGVCGTDVHMWSGTNFEGTFPFVPGHEWVGEVIALGPDVRSLNVGDRVTGECFIPCRVCNVCKDGGAASFCTDHKYYGFQWQANGSMAELHVSPEERLHRIPEALRDDEAVLIEPVSVAYYSVWGHGGRVAPHDRVAIFGAGPIGMFAMQIAKTAGAQVVVVEPQPYRQAMARDMGADEIVNPADKDATEQMFDLTDGRGFSLIVECSGSTPGIAASVDVIAVDGRIVLTGQSMGLKIPIELGKTIWKHVNIVGSCGSPGFFPHTITFLERKLVDVTKMITHRFSLDEVAAAFELGNKGTESGKIVLDIQ